VSFVETGQGIACLELVFVFDEGVVFGGQTNVPELKQSYTRPGYLMKTSVRASAVMDSLRPWQKRMWLGALLTCINL
jgi:hypothetical protein